MKKLSFSQIRVRMQIAKAKRLFQEGTSSYTKGFFRVAAEKCEEARHLFEIAGEHKLLAACENFLGNVHQIVGEPLLALQAYERAHMLHLALQDRLGEAADLANAGAAYQSLGELNRAEEYSRHALSIYEEFGRQVGIANQIGNLGNIALMRGDLAGALIAYERATTIHHQIGDPIGEATGLASQANILRLLGDLSAALDAQTSALSLTRHVGDRYGEAESLGALGLVFQNQGDLKNALVHYQLALTIRRETGDRPGEIKDLTNIANVYRIQRDFDQAVQAAQEALKIAHVSERKRDQALALASLGMAYQQQGDLGRALEFQSQAIEIASAFGDPEILWRLYGGRGETYRLWKEPLLAYEDYRFASQQIESVRSRLELDRHRLGYFSDERLVDYKHLVLLLIDHEGLYRPTEAFAYAERARARTLLDLLAQTAVKSLLQEGSIGQATSTDLGPGFPQSFEEIRAMIS